ncbi:ubiquitin-like domain-containing protein [Streptomyces sp. NPDC048507]|uniref:ubiquitin-like domain-containing protein n=1 Tax=Streptomyces sp. NPDC048507 TaxID=3365560 RepID=UPI003713E49F
MSDTQGSHRRAPWPDPAPEPGADPGAGGGPDPGADPGPGSGAVAGFSADSGSGRFGTGLAADLEAAFGPAPGAGPAPAPAAAPAPEPAVAPGPGVPSPRGEGRRPGRRRKGADREPARAAAPAPAPAAPPAGRRRAAAPAPRTPDTDGGGAGSGRRRAAVPGPAAPAPAPAVPAPGGTGRRRAAPVPAAAGEAAAPGRRRRGTAGGPAPRDSWRRIVPQALVVAFLAGGTTAFVAADKAVRITVDGVPRTLHTFAGSVDDLLAAEGLGVGPHDLVAPARASALDDGEEVVVRYGRPLHLTLDGHSREVWTTSRTVEGALRQLGVRVEGAHLSAPRTAPVPRSGLTLGVRTERGITFMADGRERTIRTNAATVQEALDQAGITLRGEDTTSVPPGSFPRDGQTVTVLRITGTREVREERIPYVTERVEDATLFAGTEVVERVGRPGARRVTYGLRTVNGVRQEPRKIAEEVVREPVGQLVKVGTKPLPSSVAGADGLDWAALAHCESGGRAAATDASGTYGGLYQFDVQTWQALGGSGRAQDATGAEQTFRAKKLYVQRGASPWPHCGRRLYR